MKIKHVHVNSNRCLAHQFCIEECPHVFSFDEEKVQAYARTESADHYENLGSSIHRAAESCPVDAIAVVLDEETDQ